MGEVGSSLDVLKGLQRSTLVCCLLCRMLCSGLHSEGHS